MRHIDRDIREMITPYLRTGVLILEDGARHAKRPSMRSQLPSRLASPSRQR